MQHTIIKPIDRLVLAQELQRCRKIKKCNHGYNELYVFTRSEAPNLMLEVARLRELTFREAGGGTGLHADLDEFDVGEAAYQQLIAWDPISYQVVGGYRFRKMKEAPLCNNTPRLSTTSLFDLSEHFMRSYFPYTLELGRSWIQPEYQYRPENRKGLFSLDNLWEGIGALLSEDSKIHFLFGKVTVHAAYNAEARDLLLNFLNYYFCDHKKLVTPRQPFLLRPHPFTGMEFETAYRLLKEELKKLGERIPPLIQSYMHISADMKILGSCINPAFGNAAETGILIAVNSIHEEKKQRYMGTALRTAA